MKYDNDIIVLCAPSGAGKDFLAEKLKNLGFNFVKSLSTRPMRDGESQGNPYNFVSKEVILDMEANNELIEIRSYDTLVQDKPDTWYYAVHKDTIKDDKQYVVVLDIEGLIDFKNHFGCRVKSFYISTRDEIRLERAKARGGFDQIEWDRRLKADAKDFSHDIVESECDHIIYNNSNRWYQALSEILYLL